MWCFKTREFSVEPLWIQVLVTNVMEKQRESWSSVVSPTSICNRPSRDVNAKATQDMVKSSYSICCCNLSGTSRHPFLMDFRTHGSLQLTLRYQSRLEKNNHPNCLGESQIMCEATYYSVLCCFSMDHSSGST